MVKVLTCVFMVNLFSATNTIPSHWSRSSSRSFMFKSVFQLLLSRIEEGQAATQFQLSSMQSVIYDEVSAIQEL